MGEEWRQGGRRVVSKGCGREETTGGDSISGPLRHVLQSGSRKRVIEDAMEYMAN